MSRFALEPIYGSLAIAVIAAIATVIIIALFTPEAADPKKRRILILLRSLAAMALLLAAFRPSLIKTDNQPADATLVIAVDTSRSMTLPDGDGNDRWTSQENAFNELASGLEALDESLSVKLITYDQQARTMDDASPDVLSHIKPTGDLTDLSAAAAAAINVVAGQPMAGVVLMGDGTQTAPLADDGARRFAETLGTLGVPLWCVAIGPAGGQSASRDVAIESLPETLSLFAGNDFDVSFQVSLRGLAGVTVPIQLEWVDLDGTKQSAASRTVIAAKASEMAAVDLTLTAPKPGMYRLLVQADEQSGEWITQNNRQIAFVDVREGGGRILYIEGMPRVEQLFLRRSLKRFPDLDLSYRWVPARMGEEDFGAAATPWPIDFGDRFDPGKFDVFVLGDLDADAIGEDQLTQLAEAVAQGAGLVTLGGFHAYGDGGYDDSPLADVLPIRMSAAGQLDGPLAIKLSEPHPITELSSQQNETTWSKLPALTGANQWSGVKSTPGVQVLMESDRGDPLLVVGEYGRGRVASLAFDSTWRWWRADNSEIHRRFWRQLMLWALSREESKLDEIKIDIDSRRFAANSPPSFRATIDSIGGADTNAKIELIAELVDESGAATPIATTQTTNSAAQDTLASISGSIPNREPGFHTLRVQPADPGSSIKPAELTIQVVDVSRELDRPMADPVYLRQLAELTAAHGGASFAPDEMAQLLRTIVDRRLKAEVPVVEKYRLGDGPISGWLLFTLFAGALSSEWFLRRRWSMA